MQIINNKSTTIGEQIDTGNIDNVNIDDLLEENSNANNSVEFRAVKRKVQFSFVTPITEEDIKEYKETNAIKAKGFNTFKISISDVDKEENGSPKIGDMIAINPKVPTDQWLIEEKYFKDNHEEEFESFGIKPVIIDLKWQKQIK